MGFFQRIRATDALTRSGFLKAGESVVFFVAFVKFSFFGLIKGPFYQSYDYLIITDKRTIFEFAKIIIQVALRLVRYRPMTARALRLQRVFSQRKFRPLTHNQRKPSSWQREPPPSSCAVTPHLQVRFYRAFTYYSLTDLIFGHSGPGQRIAAGGADVDALKSTHWRVLVHTALWSCRRAPQATVSMQHCGLGFLFLASAIPGPWNSA